MEINITAENRQLTVALTGELDHHAARKLMDSLDQLIELHLPSKTILDMASGPSAGWRPSRARFWWSTSPARPPGSWRPPA